MGLDISGGQVAAYNAWASTHGIPHDKAHAHQLDLLSSDSALGDDHPELKDLDVVAISMALHHVADPAALLARLAGCLREGGVCVVLDKLPGDQRDLFGGQTLEEVLDHVGDEAREVVTSATHTVQQQGFSEGDMKGLFEGAGLGGGIDFRVREEPFEFKLGGMEMKVNAFFARGEKLGV